MPSARTSASFPIPPPPTRRAVPHAAPGFTLNEILIAVGIIGILTSIVIVAMNPTENLLSAQHSKRRVYNRQQMTAIMQYWQDNGVDPADNIPTGLAERMPICRPGITDDPTCVNLDPLTENQTYLVGIPIDVVEAALDTNYTGYMIYQHNGADVFVCNYRLPPSDDQYCQGPATYYASSSALSGGIGSDASSSTAAGGSAAGGSSAASSTSSCGPAVGTCEDYQSGFFCTNEGSGHEWNKTAQQCTDWGGCDSCPAGCMEDPADYFGAWPTCPVLDNGAHTTVGCISACAAQSDSSSSSVPVASSSISSSSSSSADGLAVNCTELAGQCIDHCGVTINPGDGKYCSDVVGNPTAYPYLCMACISVE